MKIKQNKCILIKSTFAQKFTEKHSAKYYVSLAGMTMKGNTSKNKYPNDSFWLKMKIFLN